MRSNLTPTNIVFLFCLLLSVVLHYGFFTPESNKARLSIVLGQNSEQINFEDLTVIARMPFLSHDNRKVDISKLAIDDSIFYIPKPVIIEDQEPSEAISVEDFAPVEIVIPKPDLFLWAKNNLKLQMTTNNGAIINDTFYKKGAALASLEAFEDGSYFSATVIDIGKGYATLDIADGKRIKLTLME